MTAQNVESDAALVDRILAPWRTLDVPAILESFEPDGVLQSMMGTPIRGRDNIGKILTRHLSHLNAVEFEILSFARNGDVLFTERVDHLISDTGEVLVPIIGVIYLRAGKIREWREYYDHAQASVAPKPRAEAAAG